MPIHFDKSFWDNTWTHRNGINGDLGCAILAAGLGRRLDPLTTRYLPKPMFPLGGKIPMAEIWVRRMVESGIRGISMNLCVLSETIKRHFQDGCKFGCSITYVEEEQPSGTLGGVCKQALGSKAKRLPGEKSIKLEPFKGSTLIVPSGDIVSHFGPELLEEMYVIHKRAGAAFTVVLVPVPWERRKDFGTAVLRRPESKKGIVSKSGRIKEFIEKDPNSPSNLSNASIYMVEVGLLRHLDPLRTEARTDIPEPFYDFGKHVLPALLGKLPYISIPKQTILWGIQYNGKWFDVGQKRDYLRVNECLLNGELNVPLPYEKLPWGYLGTDVAIEFGKVKIVPPVVIGNNCIIEAGATIGPYAVVGDGWIIEKGATVRNSVLWEPYPCFDDTGKEDSPTKRRLVDRHEIRRNVTVKESIIAGGTIESDVIEKTVEVSSDGKLRALSIDYVPKGPRT